MIAIIDANYSDDGSALVVAVLLENFNDTEPTDILYSEVESMIDCKQVATYKRELPVLLRVFEEHNIHPETIIIDGLVHMPDHSDAIGMHLYDLLKSIYPPNKHKTLKILGIAKDNIGGFNSYYKTYRNSINPLIVTTNHRDIGIADAVSLVKDLPGQYRLPEMVKLADHACRGMI